MHPELVSRLRARLNSLLAVHAEGGPTAITGQVREAALRELILPSLPPNFRTTSGQIVDQYGAATGQLDLIVENGLFPSIRSSASDTRLVLAEGTAAAIEVKSTVPSQWSQVTATASKLSPIRRRYRNGGRSYGPVGDRVPLFVVAYHGWSTVASLEDRLEEADAILVLSPAPIFAARIYADEVIKGTGENALWAFICSLHFVAGQLLEGTTDLFAYGRGIIPE